MDFVTKPDYENKTFSYLRKTYNCTTDNAVDPDVAGIGVIISFLLSAAITILGILIGWFQNALPGFPNHPVDFLIKNFFCHLFLRREYNNTPAGERTKEAFQNFILTLSDQQLVTGFAILTSAYFKGNITVYSFQLVSTLAWFSSMVHLATLVVLKQYLRRNKWVRICRICIMVVIGCLLIASRLQSASIILYQPWFAMYCGSLAPGAFNLLSFLFTAAWLVFAFMNRIMDLCLDERNPYSRSWLMETIMRRIDPLAEPARSNLDALKETKFIKQPWNDVYRFSAYVALAEFVLKELMDSFAWEIAWLLFAFSYGLANTVIAWDSCAQPGQGYGSCWESVLEMGFGQMVPLILLLLPFFAFLETYSSRDESSNTGNSSIADAGDDNATQIASHTTGNTASGANINNSPSQTSRKGLYDDIQIIKGDGDPYQTRTIKQLVIGVYGYWILILIAAGVLSGAIVSDVGFILTIMIVVITYWYSFVGEFSLMIKALRKKYFQG